MCGLKESAISFLKSLFCYQNWGAAWPQTVRGVGNKFWNTCFLNALKMFFLLLERESWPLHHTTDGHQGESHTHLPLVFPVGIPPLSTYGESESSLAGGSLWFLGGNKTSSPNQTSLLCGCHSPATPLVFLSSAEKRTNLALLF